MSYTVEFWWSACRTLQIVGPRPSGNCNADVPAGDFLHSVVITRIVLPPLAHVYYLVWLIAGELDQPLASASASAAEPGASAKGTS